MHLCMLSSGCVSKVAPLYWYSMLLFYSTPAITVYKDVNSEFEPKDITFPKIEKWTIPICERQLKYFDQNQEKKHPFRWCTESKYVIFSTLGNRSGWVYQRLTCYHSLVFFLWIPRNHRLLLKISQSIVNVGGCKHEVNYDVAVSYFNP